jgi:hypothetical protein
MVGQVLGLQIANAVMAPGSSPAARAAIIANWIKIANVIVSHIQTTAIVNLPPITAPGGANLAGFGGPVSGVITPLPGKIS